MPTGDDSQEMKGSSPASFFFSRPLRATNLFTPSLLPSIPHLVCHNEELSLKVHHVALVATPTRLQDEPDQLGLKSLLHLSFGALLGKSGGKSSGTKTGCAATHWLDQMKFSL